MILQQNYEFISRQIETARNQDHLDTCRRLIEQRIEVWGAWDMINDLLNKIQVREVELLATVYEEAE